MLIGARMNTHEVINKEKAVSKLRKLIIDEYDNSNIHAADCWGMSRVHLSRILNSDEVKIPDELLDEISMYKETTAITRYEDK